MAKNTLVGLREGALRHLADLSLMNRSVDIELRTNVMPWVVQKTEGQIGDLQGMDNIAEKVLDDCVFSHATSHARTLELREQGKLEKERKARQAVKDTEIRKKNRRLARAKAEKDAKIAALKAEIRKVFFERAEVIHPATSNELLDFHGNYLKKTEHSTWNAFTGAIGGHI
jgi:hypothetical protein